MEMSLSPLLAEIFMDDIEQKIFANNLSKNVIKWARYVDDILVILKGQIPRILKSNTLKNKIYHWDRRNQFH